MGEVVDKVRAQHFRARKLGCRGVEGLHHIPQGGNGGHKALGLYADIVVTGSQPVQALGHLADGAQGEGAQQQGHQGAAHQTDGGDDQEEGQDAGVLHPLAQLPRAVYDQQGRTDDQQGHQRDHEDAAGKGQGQGHAALALLLGGFAMLHTFFTAL